MLLNFSNQRIVFPTFRLRINKAEDWSVTKFQVNKMKTLHSATVPIGVWYHIGNFYKSIDVSDITTTILDCVAMTSNTENNRVVKY